jgi:hypothetical protein
MPQAQIDEPLGERLSAPTSGQPLTKRQQRQQLAARRTDSASIQSGACREVCAQLATCVRVHVDR